MSLNFRFEKIKNWETVTKDGDRMSVVTESLIWSTMGVGLGKITEENVDEWMIRLAFLDKLMGPMMVRDGEPRPFTREELVAHIGLYTNVTNEVRTRWAKRVMENYFKEEEYRMKRAMEQAKNG